MQHIKRTASSIAKQIFETKGKIFAELMSEWDVIIGINFAHKCYPKKICSVVDGENKINILYISCDDVVTSFEIEYKKETILERIAVYFGFKIVHQIKTK